MNCEHCGCLLPDEYHPNCKQCGGWRKVAREEVSRETRFVSSSLAWLDFEDACMPSGPLAPIIGETMAAYSDRIARWVGE